MKLTANKNTKKEMKKYYLLQIFKSNYCKFVFLISLIGVYFLVPKKVFYSYYTLIGITFIITTSLIITCLIRIIKENVLSAKASGASLLGILSIIFGFGALQACTIGAPVCGATIGGGILALIFPGFAFNLIEKYSIPIVLISVLIQLLTLYLMKCFKKQKGIISNLK